MQLFVAIGKNWKLLIIVKKSFVLDVYGLIDFTLVVCVSEKQSGTSD